MVPGTCSVLMEGARSKIVSLCEFSLLALNNFVKFMHPDFFNMGNTVAVDLIRGLGEIMESKKPKLIKCCTPVLKELIPKLQSVSLEEALVFVFMPINLPEEEEKCNEEEMKASKRAKQVVADLAPPKKVDKSATFRSFMKTQKKEVTGIETVVDQQKAMTVQAKPSKDMAMFVDQKYEVTEKETPITISTEEIDMVKAPSDQNK